MAAEGSDCPLSGSGRGTALRQFRSTSASDPEKGLVEKHPGTASLSQSDPIGGQPYHLQHCGGTFRLKAVTPWGQASPVCQKEIGFPPATSLAGAANSAVCDLAVSC